MAEAFKDHFSGVAQGYQAFRPGYPPALFPWLADLAPGRELAADLGCGTGQASIALADYFRAVVGIDPSTQQIAHAVPRRGVEYRVAPAEATGLPGGCADLIVAAQALHWFDQPRLHAEVSRIAKPGAVFAAFTYNLCRVDQDVDAGVDRLYQAILGPFWPPERAHVESGYRTLPFPWTDLPTPSFTIRERWDLANFVGYLRTWSAVGAYARARAEDPIALVMKELENAWGAPGQERAVTWELTIRAGRVVPTAATGRTQ